MTQSTQSSQLNVKVRSPFTIYYEGPALSVSAQNPVGPFDILPGHANFFSILSPCEIKVDSGTEPKSFVIANGIITAQDNEVLLFVNV